MSNLYPSLNLTPIAVYLLVAAPAVGSFLALAADRWPEGVSILGRSKCADCGTQLKAWHMLPLISYALNNGRCKTCGAAIPMRLWWMEWAALLVALPIVLLPSLSAQIITALLGWCLLLLAELDRRHFWLPDALTLSLLLAGALYLFAFHANLLPAHALAAASAYLFIWLFNRLYKSLRGRDGLGMGDAKLLAATAMWLGPFAIPAHLLLASASALLVTVVGQRQTKKETEVPLGLYLSISFYGQWLAAYILPPSTLKLVFAPAIPTLMW